jgi:two-component system response regulator YesN
MNKNDLIKVLIVDDSLYIREDIKTVIDWSKYGFIIIGEATNGRQGIEAYNNLHPDLIITDIKMPIMDGLEMSNALVDRIDAPKIILLSAYNDFDFARKAIKLNIGNYVLKHEMDDPLFIKLILKLKEDILKKYDELQTQINIQFYKLIFNNDNLLLTNSYFKEKYVSINNIYQIIVLKENKINNQVNRSKEEIFIEIIKKSNCKINIISEIFKYNYSIFLITMKKETEYSTVERLLQIVIKKYNDETEDFLVVSSSERFFNLKDIYKQYLITINNIKYHKNKPVIISKDIIIKEYDHAYINKLIASFFDSLRSKNIERTNIILNEMEEICLINQNIQCFNTIRDNIRKNDLIFLSNNINKELIFSDFITVSSFFKKIIVEINDSYTFNGRVLSERMKKIINFINKNITNEISISDLAEEFTLSNVYVGQIIKKELGISFKTYLANVKIEKAKELLKSGEYKIYEISDILGYKTVQYFSNMFKNTVGVSPKDYF